MDHAVQRLKKVQATLEGAARRYGLPDTAAHSSQLVAVSKGFDANAIAPVLAAGQRHFGENRVQEAAKKWPDFRAQYPDILLHLIGPLQSNKVKEALDLFDVIHTLDREKLALELAKQRDEKGRNIPPLLIQVNIGKEPQKVGIMPKTLGEFVGFARKKCGLPVQGLMCIPPAGEPPAPFFLMLKEMAQDYNLLHLSMGMSADYELAAAMGAHYVRVGSAIFGPRQAA